jgi:hypothetical protein
MRGDKQTIKAVGARHHPPNMRAASGTRQIVFPKHGEGWQQPMVAFVDIDSSGLQRTLASAEANYFTIVREIYRTCLHEDEPT